MDEKKLNPKVLEQLGLTEDDFKPKKITTAERAEAQALYTAILTDTVLEEEEEEENA